MKKHFKFIALLLLQTVNLNSFSERDHEKLGYDFSRVITTFVCGLIIPELISNPPKTNFKEYFQSKFSDQNSQILAEINKLELRLIEIKEEIKSSDDYPKKRLLKEEKTEILAKIDQLKSDLNRPVKWYKKTVADKPTNEATALPVVKQSILQQQLLDSLNSTKNNSTN
jgi:hypothetical protein